MLKLYAFLIDTIELEWCNPFGKDLDVSRGILDYLTKFSDEVQLWNNGLNGFAELIDEQDKCLSISDYGS